MANEKRVRQNFIGGLVDTADLAAAGTTLYSAALAAITTTIDSTNHMPITLDPDGIYGAPEIAYITALTVGSTSCTLLRGQEGTTARQHLMDTPWVHGPTVRDYGAAGRVAWAQHVGTIAAGSATTVDLCTDADVTVTAQAGDILMVGIAARAGTEANDVFLDAQTRVSGAGVNRVSGQYSGMSGWSVLSSFGAPVGAAYPYRVQAGDVSAGKVTLRMQYITATATPTRSVVNPLLTVLNLGPQEA